MWGVDLFTTYLYALRAIAFGLAVVVCLSSLDDLFIDVVYWSRRVWRALTVYSQHPRMTVEQLRAIDEKPLAIMVPAWQEHGVIDRMAELEATTLDYENYHIFVGTYPNDPETQADVEKVCARFPNVHKVVGALPGPTSKADCLNNVLNAIQQFEGRAGIRFEGFILHDSEDVLSPMELRMFNHLVGRKDLIQVPVFPMPKKWYDFTSGHYVDEFAELHAKDVPVREALVGQVPSAGVGTCFSRRAIEALIEYGNGVAFDVKSLTEDYDIGLRLKLMGMKEVFVRFPTDPYGLDKSNPTGAGFGHSRREASTIGVREYFPSSPRAAMRQKSRWIIGIIYQGYKTLGWSDKLGLNYFLWRDRKGVITNFASLLAMVLMLQMVGLWMYQTWIPDSYRFLSIFADSTALIALLWINLGLMINRMAQRIYFVTANYGLAQGALAVPRLLWGNIINFAANWRAFMQTVQAQDVRRIAWAKTDHDFPTLGNEHGMREPLGEILVRQGALSQSQLDDALAMPVQGLRLGAHLVHAGLVLPEQLAAAVAEQVHADWETFDCRTLQRTPELLEKLPPSVAKHYAVVPLRTEDSALVLASESYLDPVSLAAIARRIGTAVRYVIVPKGQVTVALRQWYGDGSGRGPLEEHQDMVRACGLEPAAAETLWKSYVARQVLLGDVVQALGRLDPAALNSVLIRRAKTTKRLGEFMVAEGVMSQEELGKVLELQGKLQLSMERLVDRARPRRAVRVKVSEQPS